MENERETKAKVDQMKQENKKEKHKPWHRWTTKWFRSTGKGWEGMDMSTEIEQLKKLIHCKMSKLS